MGRLNGLDRDTVNRLFLGTQPAHLQKLNGEKLDGSQRSIVRAEYLRRTLESQN
jgi:protein arginine kinase